MPLNTIPNKGLTNQGYPTDRLVTPIIINGDMSVAQRSTSESSYGSVAYSTVDRFKTVFEVGTYTVSQESLSSGEAYNNGFRKAFKALVTSTASPPSAGSQTTFEQRIEGQNLQIFKKGTTNAEPFTLSFWVKSSKTGSNLQVNLRDSDNTRQVGGTYDISATNTWEKKIINFPADTTGAFNDDNGTSLTIEWWLDGGSNYSGGAVPTAWEASSNADRNVTNFDLAGGTDSWHITGVQLEVGTPSSDFEFLPYDVNLARCMRYCQKNPQTSSGGDYKVTASGFADGTSLALCSINPFSVEMRTVPSLTSSGSFRIHKAGGASSVSGVAIDSDTSGSTSFTIRCTTSSLTGGQGVFLEQNNDADAHVILDSEL